MGEVIIRESRFFTGGDSENVSQQLFHVWYSIARDGGGSEAVRLQLTSENRDWQNDKKIGSRALHH